MRFASLLTVLSTAVGVSTAAPLESPRLSPRGTIGHDKVVGFNETVPSGSMGDAYLKFKPFLKIVNGCVPFPAVDAAGDTSGGLEPTGSSSGGCDSSTGQVYARGTEVNGSVALMYAWYMPKDSPITGLGHRHDWEAAVVWIDSLDSQKLLGGATSAHGGFDAKAAADLPLDGDRLKVQYFSVPPVDHQLGTTDDEGGQQPLIAYESLTDAARSALENTDFGSANVPFKDANFMNNLVKAALT